MSKHPVRSLVGSRVFFCTPDKRPYSPMWAQEGFKRGKQGRNDGMRGFRGISPFYRSEKPNKHCIELSIGERRIKVKIHDIMTFSRYR